MDNAVISYRMLRSKIAVVIGSDLKMRSAPVHI